MVKNDCSNMIDDSLEIVAQHTDTIISNYSKFFNIAEVFSSDERGKIKLNRNVFNNVHLLVEKDIKAINLELNKVLDTIKENLASLFSNLSDIKYIDWKNLIFDDELCIQEFHKDLGKQTFSQAKKREQEKELVNFIYCKNRMFTLQYLVTLFDTSILDNTINKLTTEDLINSTLIFGIIDSYGLQLQKLLQFESEIRKKETLNNIDPNLHNLNDILELLKRRYEDYTYNNIRYKISYDYNNTITPKDLKNIDVSYLEHLIYTLSEQSCLDIVKKELKKGKITKTISLDIVKVKNRVNIVVVNSGFDTKDISSFYTMGNIENKFILNASNIAKLLKTKIDITPIDNEGMKYSISLA